MVRVAYLSTEILLNVVSHFTTGDNSDVRTLLHLCRASRALFNVAQPALHTCVRIPEPEAELLYPLKLFLRTLIERPSLAKMTQELALFNDRGVRYEWPALEQDAVFMEISSLIGGNPFEIEPDLCYYPLAVQVLARLPNLRHLYFTAQIEPPRSLFQRVHEIQADTSLLSKLKTFHLHKQYEDGPVDIDDYVHFMKYPSFEKFSSQSDVPDSPGVPRAINTITHTAVELLWCMRPLSTMKRLLNNCPRLIHLKFVIPDGARYRWQWDVGYQPLVTPRDLVKTLLETHRHNLQTLHLDFHHYYDLSDPELRAEIGRLEDCDYTYPSFRGFKSLSHLTVEFEKLVKVHDLPESLEWLDLCFCHFADLDAACLKTLVQLREKWCPSIKSITVSGQGSLATVKERAISLGLPARVSVDGRVLTILCAGCHLTIRSLTPSCPARENV